MKYLFRKNQRFANTFDLVELEEGKILCTMRKEEMMELLSDYASNWYKEFGEDRREFRRARNEWVRAQNNMKDIVDRIAER